MITRPEQLPQIARLCEAISMDIGPHCIGIYLHGSLAMGCFQPARSDIDVLVVTHDMLPVATKGQMIADLLLISKTPYPVEISFMTWAQLHPWRYPCLYDLHFSEAHRERFAHDLLNDAWHQWNDKECSDIDLAAHVTVARARGIRLVGQSLIEVLPSVPATDYLAALRYDFAEYEELCMTNPVYCVLNCCRLVAYQRKGVILSKAEGGAYALKHLPLLYHAIIKAALAAYTDEIAERDLDNHACQVYVAYALAELSL